MKKRRPPPVLKHAGKCVTGAPGSRLVKATKRLAGEKKHPTSEALTPRKAYARPVHSSELVFSREVENEFCI